MPQVTFRKLERIEARHPGFWKRVDDMLEAFATLKAVESMIATEYGERISDTTLRKYKRQSWSVRRRRLQVESATLAARRELASEGRI